MRAEMVGDFAKYDPHTCEVVVTEICTARGMKLSTRSSSLRPDSTCSSDEVQVVSAVPSLNTLDRVSALLS